MKKIINKLLKYLEKNTYFNLNSHNIFKIKKK